MAFKKIDYALYGGRDPREIGAFTFREAHTAVGVSASTLRWWVRGRDGYRPPIELSDPESNLLSFINLVEVHVLAAMRRYHGVSLPNIRRALDYCREHLDVDRPLAVEPFETDGVYLFVRRLGEIINASRKGQLVMKSVVEAYLERIDYDDARTPIRFYPFLRRSHGMPDLNMKEKVIVVDPLISFGRPVIQGTRIPTSSIHDRFIAGESVDSIARDYSLKRSLIEEAIRYEEAA